VKVVAPAAAVPTWVKWTPSVERSTVNPDSLSEPGRQATMTSDWDLNGATCDTLRPFGAPRAVGPNWVTVTWSTTALAGGPAVVPLVCAVRARPTNAFVPMCTVCGPPRFCQAPWLWPLLTSTAQ